MLHSETDFILIKKVVDKMNEMLLAVQWTDAAWSSEEIAEQLIAIVREHDSRREIPNA